ncbi:phosphatase PAP2 family protein [Sphingomonas sp. CGMCC 1.13654]|uniref:Acid phosphatase n=1 Tax=Sphingomonas chungangi TaxID=2683589 RepID=A0A838L4D3_9SPHN|nr:phosphatase PAP2 family protein [Sphingomonas chungangi]MBA2933299.1 phosphatase PAP2 family protein [Sphingomonas chungangi]MVW57969.1 phosphatase PAP2 family protein [Sphingomonas chungangi]
MRTRLLATIVLAAASFATILGAEKPQGYLAPGAFDLLQVLPPAPVKGDPRYKADRTIFKQTRRMIGSPRYQLATSDAVYEQPALMKDFSCAVGVALTPQDAPKTKALVDRALIDTESQTNTAKNFYKRLRPYKIDQGEICQPKSDLGDSYDYPSGHTTLGWTWAEVLTDLLPERATMIQARGRAYGDSRFICGAHNMSAVEAGKLSAGATMAVVRTTPAYQADAAAARAELRGLLADPTVPKPDGCAKEGALIAQRVL